MHAYTILKLYITYRDKIDKIKEIRQNLHESIYELVVHMKKLEISFDTPQSQKRGEWILEFGKKAPQHFNDVRTTRLQFQSIFGLTN